MRCRVYTTGRFSVTLLFGRRMTELFWCLGRFIPSVRMKTGSPCASMTTKVSSLCFRLVLRTCRGVSMNAITLQISDGFGICRRPSRAGETLLTELVTKGGDDARRT